MPIKFIGSSSSNMTPAFPTSFWLLLLPIAFALHAMLRVAQGTMCRRWEGFTYWSWRSLIGIALFFAVIAIAFRFTNFDICVGCVLAMLFIVRGRLNRQLDRQLLLSVVNSASDEQQRYDALISVVNCASGWTRRHAKRILKKEKKGQEVLAIAGRRTARRDIDKVLLRAKTQPITPSVRDSLLRRVRNLDLQLDATSVRLQVCFSLFATGPLVVFYHTLLTQMKDLFEEFPGTDLSLFEAFTSNTPVWLSVKIAVTIVLLLPVIFLFVRSFAPGLLRLPPLAFIHRHIARSLTLTTLAQLVAEKDTVDAINVTRDIVESKRERRMLEFFRELVIGGMQLPDAAFKSGLLPSKFRSQIITSNEPRLLDNAAVLFAEHLITKLKCWACVTVVVYTLVVSAALIAHGLVFFFTFTKLLTTLA